MPLLRGGDTIELEVSLVGLGDLGSEYVYEGCLIPCEGPITTGRFNLESGDEYSDTLRFSKTAFL